jgi:hypothetical protein
MLRSRPSLAAAALAVTLAACGGGSGGGGSSPPPSPTPQNPCNTAALETESAEPAAVPDVALAERKKAAVDGNPRWRVLDALWKHREAMLRRGGAEMLTPTPNDLDVGDVAVVQDEGDIVLPPNSYDLRNLGLRFTRNGSGGYDVRRTDGAFRSTLGTRLTLTDDDSQDVAIPFSFPFYGTTQTLGFVNSDGNITFGEADKASTDRNVARLLTGPPRVAPFLADLDPSTGGRVYVNATTTEYTVTWCGVRGFDTTQTTTVQATMLPDGTVEMNYGETITLGDAVVGISPGHTGDFKPVNLSDSGPSAGGSGAVGERFARAREVDSVALTKKFYRTHPDNYDQLVIWADARVIQSAFAYETTIANEIRGIGIDVYDVARDFGSAGRLRSIVHMDWLGKYPDDPGQKFLGENNTVSVLGQESGHRWLAFLEFRDHNGQRSDLLLGRDLAHWSFFFDSDASVMEGNDIEDLGGGSFRTIGAVSRYSRLDQYAMGLVAESAVPPFFYVESPTNSSPAREREDAPRIGVTFNGTRRDVLIQDIVAIHGLRSPSVAESPKVHRQAFVYLVTTATTPDAGQVAKVDRIRVAWEAFFRLATDGRMRAVTTLK